jgi:hypothetical protein
LLFGLGVSAIAAIFVLCIAGGAVHRGNLERLEKLETDGERLLRTLNGKGS